MAKKKQSKPQQQSISPVRFLKERVRQVPVYRCYLSHDFENATEGTVMVVRKHTGDKYTCGLYLVDKYCLGVKDASYHLRMDEDEFEEFLDLFEEDFNPHVVTYEEAHNWVWGAVGFAEDAGISPCKEFDLAQYVLAEDDDEVELIEYDFGDKDGRHCLLANDRLEASTYLPLMRKNLGDEFTFCLGPNDSIHEPDDWDFEKNCPRYDDTGLYEQDMNDGVEYCQEHPDYPDTLSLKNTDIAEMLSCKAPKLKTPEDVDAFLKRDGLREDLEQYILYYIGRTNDTAYDADPTVYDDDRFFDPNLLMAVRLLAEVGDGHSLEVLLEGLRQYDSFYEFHFGNALAESYVPAVARLGAGHLDKLKAFVLEHGLYDMAHDVVIEALAQIYSEHEECKEEIAGCFREFLTAFRDSMDEGDTTLCSRVLTGFAVSVLMGMDSEELLPLVKELFEKDYVDQEVCGTYINVSTTILTHQGYNTDYDTDIHKWLEWYNLTFESNE